MNLARRRSMFAALAVTAAAAVTAGTGLANPTNHSGKAQTAFAAQTQSVAKVYGPGPGPVGGWHTVGTTMVDSTAGETIVARFSAESACYGDDGWCAARILVDGKEANPKLADFAFDHTDRDTATAASTESHSMERVYFNNSMAAQVPVEVQVKPMGADIKHRLDDWTLTAYSIAP